MLATRRPRDQVTFACVAQLEAVAADGMPISLTCVVGVGVTNERDVTTRAGVSTAVGEANACRSSQIAKRVVCSVEVLMAWLRQILAELTHNNAHVWANLKEKYGDKVEMLEDQEWNKTDWDWIIK